MNNVLALHRLDAAMFDVLCGNSDVSCDSGASCASNVSCDSNASSRPAFD